MLKGTHPVFTYGNLILLVSCKKAGTPPEGKKKSLKKFSENTARPPYDNDGGRRKFDIKK